MVARGPSQVDAIYPASTLFPPLGTPTAALARSFCVDFYSCFIHGRTRTHFPMPTETQRLEDYYAIRNYVNQTLCEKDRLEAGFFPLSESLLVRRGSPCGVYFCLHGPRSLCLTAIWETDGNTIMFYGSRGERFRTTKLVEPPRIEEQLPKPAP
jgi:hypothetical protein